MPKLTPKEREEFLDVRMVICNIATVDQSGAPLVTPIGSYAKKIEYGSLLDSTPSG